MLIYSNWLPNMDKDLLRTVIITAFGRINWYKLTSNWTCFKKQEWGSNHLFIDKILKPLIKRLLA